MMAGVAALLPSALTLRRTALVEACEPPRE